MEYRGKKGSRFQEFPVPILVNWEEVVFEFSRSGGPGGQNVNKTSSRVTLCCDIGQCSWLSASQKILIFRKLSGRINRQGILRLSASQHRSQAQNRRAVKERFVELLTAALTLSRRRLPTKVSRTQKKQRVDTKKNRGRAKQLRRQPASEKD